MIYKILEIAFSGFWNFIGVIILINTVLYFLVNGVVKIWSRLTRMIMVLIHGWPPDHLDADGDFEDDFYN